MLYNNPINELLVDQTPQKNPVQLTTEANLVFSSMNTHFETFSTAYEHYFDTGVDEALKPPISWDDLWDMIFDDCENGGIRWSKII